MAVPRFHALTISDLRRETADAVSLAFAVPDRLREAYRYTPGQYLTLRATIDGVDEAHAGWTRGCRARPG